MGMPSTKTRWQPTPRVEWARARATASSKRGPGGHERGRREHAGLVQLDNGAVDAGRETEVVCVEDEARRHAPLIVEVGWGERRKQGGVARFVSDGGAGALHLNTLSPTLGEETVWAVSSVG